MSLETEAAFDGAPRPHWVRLRTLIYLRCRRRDLAFQTFRDILRAEPGHAETRASMRRLGVRTSPVFPFLPRSHPLNKYTGKVIYRARQLIQGREQAGAAA